MAAKAQTDTCGLYLLRSRPAREAALRSLWGPSRLAIWLGWTFVARRAGSPGIIWDKVRSMVKMLEIATILVVALTGVTSIAHALEFRGKMRLSREDYLAVEQFIAQRPVGTARYGPSPSVSPRNASRALWRL